uniref:Uncharacterized protein n=1 Tax=Syphacia muris TaxID=451379 RepID=A0A0N5AF84_9BILA
MIYSTSIRSAQNPPALAVALFGASRIIRTTTKIHHSTYDEERAADKAITATVTGGETSTSATAVGVTTLPPPQTATATTVKVPTAVVTAAAVDVPVKKRYSFIGHKLSHASATVAPTTCRFFYFNYTYLLCQLNHLAFRC